MGISEVKSKRKMYFIVLFTKKERKLRVNVLLKDIEKLQEVLVENQDDDMLKETLICREAELQKIHEEYVRGIMVRTRATWIPEGEKNSCYFLNLEKRNFDKKHIQQLVKGDVIITEPSDILTEEKQFYENLYNGTSNNIDYVISRAH